ncbi:helicase associated domain-containing protein [Streptomyces anulatus]|uniref:helicase associated domain-containing protein n=1 Tax=Streptomyces anulatus TaxID=1892 RepID=UPI002E344859|nr:helicase associated domain-containing protein [Streptomyces anulatus]
MVEYLRRAGALDGHPEWEAALMAVDADWNPSWPAEWQRHYAALRELVADEEGRADVLPGFTVHGMDIGKWLARQRKPEVWQALTGGQRERLEQLGITPPVSELPKPSAPALGAFERGVAALAQYKAREGSVAVPRGHEERIGVGGQEYPVKLGVWIMNQKGRRAKLAADNRARRRARAEMGARVKE